jgi:type IV pilus assembly protein PilP
VIRLSHLTPARITATALLLVLAGCADPRLDELQAYADQVMSRPGGIIEPLPEFRIVGNYLYRSADDGLRDPFEPFIEKEKKEPTAVVTRDPQQEAYEFEVKVRPKEELESYELDSLRMVGTMQDDGSQWGIVVDPTGTVHRVEVGNHMGRNSGKVTAIEEGRIDLREIVGDAETGYDERDAAIALPGET